MDFENMTLAQLKELAKEKGVKNITKFKKEDIISILKDLIFEESEEQVAEQKFTETITEEGYKLTNEGDEIVTGILEVLPDGYRVFKR